MAVHINCPGRIGARPGNPFHQYIAVTGVSDLRVTGLPEGLAFDSAARLVTGTTPPRGIYEFTVAAGDVTQSVCLVAGEQLALTPTLGWSSWNYCGRNVSDAKVRAMARAMVDTGLIDSGYSYINIDDGWQGERCPETRALQPNEKFPDMQGLCYYMHSLGLKIGIYSTPWKISYAGFTGGSADTPDGHVDLEKQRGPGKTKHGAYSFHDEDARQFAKWGFDYLKYDWNPIDVEHTRLMSEALRASGRDIVFSLSNSAPFEQACEWARLSNVWRTTGDITDSFKSIENAKTWEHSILQCGFMTEDRWAPYVGPGHWADPDMLVVGNFGLGGDLRESRLALNEQKVHLTQWGIVASPLLLGCDISQLKTDVLELLKNEEVLAVNQDVLGRQACRIKTFGKMTHESWGDGRFHGEYHELEIWSKELADGSRAVALYNLADDGCHEIGFSFADIGLSGECRIRDLWGRKELGGFRGGFCSSVDSHDCLLIRVSGAGL